MRFVVELTDGVTTIKGAKGTAAEKTSVVQPIAQVKDILQATRLDIGVTFFSVTMTGNNPGTTTARLYFESSMQNVDESLARWEPVGDSGGLDLVDAIDKGLPCEFVMTSAQDFGRYLRWRIEIDADASPIDLTAIFKITVLGHG